MTESTSGYLWSGLSWKETFDTSGFSESHQAVARWVAALEVEVAVVREAKVFNIVDDESQ